MANDQLTAAPSKLFKLRNAAKTVDEQLTQEQKYPELLDLLANTAPGAGVGGSSASEQQWPVFLKQRAVTLPNAIVQQYDILQCRSFMGLLPEINRAWITVDNKLFLWNYIDGTDFYSFEDQDQIIVSVGLVPPKRDVFVDGIEYVLVIATTLEIILLGVSTTDPSGAPSSYRGQKLSLFVTQLSVPSDDVSMTNIVGTADGRIFMCGDDGHLYEVTYKAAETFFGSRCQKRNLTQGALYNFIPSFFNFTAHDKVTDITVDDQRKLLYALTAKSSIRVYNLATEKTTEIAAHTDICRSAQNLWPTSSLFDARTFRIVSIHATSPKESREIKLVAVTSNGCRLYFRLDPTGYRPFDATGNAQSNVRSDLRLIQIRGPLAQISTSTGFGNGTVANQQYVYASLYSKGVFLASAQSGDSSDTLFAAEPNEGKILTQTATTNRPTFSEIENTIVMEGKTWAIAEYQPNVEPSYLTIPETGISLPEIACQRQNQRRQFLILTNFGINLLLKLRPVDMLAHIITFYGELGQHLSSFIETYGTRQLCAMCLALICEGDGARTTLALSSSAMLIDSATKLFFEHGGKPSVMSKVGQGTTALSDIGKPVTTTETQFSSKHDGVALFLARTLRPIWKQSLKDLCSPQNPAVRQDLYHVQRCLIDLKSFVEKFPLLMGVATASQARSPGSMELQNDAVQIELESLRSLYTLIEESIEAISFILTIANYDLAAIVASLPASSQQTHAELTYETLLTTDKGRALSRDLVTAIISRPTSASGLTADALSDILQQKCAHFCSTTDVSFYKAAEHFRLATETKDSRSRRNLLQESLKLYSKAAGSLPIDKLQELTQQYCQLHFHLGAVQLALTAAKDHDVLDRAVGYVRDGMPASDDRVSFWEYRKRCYECVFNTLMDVEKLKDQDIAPGDLIDDVSVYKTQVRQKALSSNDGLFHRCLYDWYIERNLTDQILEIQSPHLIEYLKGDPVTLMKQNLLWRSYVRAGSFGKAAQVLAFLASSDQFGLSLDDRIEYLSLAVSNARSQRGSASMGHMDISDLEDTLQVAQGQKEVYYRIRMKGEGYEEYLEALDKKLVTISELYSGFALPLGLWEMVLWIFDTANHQDIYELKRVWMSLVKDVHDAALAAHTDPLQMVAYRVQEIAHRYYPSENVMHLDTVMNVLESYGRQQGVPNAHIWARNLLTEAGVVVND
ncbi:hypothetical protein BZG36_03265 [Bifiguratus adelaidae]|uniref:Nucleoporin Nup133/Nup155-like N-terminal domain-containing protein n=1 Tax=Bifiguratus adelaidae TaxID=1938954 RepID=A0A261XXE4_9FUNG|nr:hypothetical protein BZG36_03265 [Bifiguratus adelaidae]